MQICPCQSGKDYPQCCGVFITGSSLPLTPEALMRSRYTAYTQANIDYIMQTMKGPAAQHFVPEEAAQWARQVTWLGLEVIQAEQQGDRGWVEFIAFYEEAGKKIPLHERSEFLLEQGRWFYVSGQSPKAPGRNDLCPCGSQKKFKKCCM